MKTALEPALVAATAAVALALVGSAAFAPTDPVPPRGGPPAEIVGDGTRVTETATWIPGCPSGTLFAHEPDLPGFPPVWHFGLSDDEESSVRVDSFFDVTEPICGISWYGVMMGWTLWTGFFPCDEDPASFTVTFRIGTPGGPVAGSHSATLEATPTGITYPLSSGEFVELKRWAMTFPCVDLAQGWVMIYGAGGDPGCYFYWLSSEVEGSHYFWSDGSFDLQPWNLSFCLLKEGCGTGAAGNCYVSNGSPFCNNLDCCVTVCDVDAFCCDVEWDVECAIAAGELCGNCGGADAGTCFADNDTPGCDDAGCCQIVCIVDPYCCNVEWDGACSDHAREMCEGACCLPSGGCLDDEPAGDCMAAGGTFHGVNESCSSVVCPFPQCPGVGSCYADNGSSGCNSAACCNVVCNADSFCCTSFWDHICAEAALELCGDCGGADAGSCSASNGSPGCNDYDCCAAVCVFDDYCCNVTWDNLCAEEAANLCGQSCPCDHDGDGDIDVDDLLAILGAWGGPGGDCTGDGTTNVDDLLGALGAWGGCP